jgi:archaellum biogenesis ATPase FlaH
MIISSNINNRLLNNKFYNVLILDVNSLFLFAGRNGIKNMYKFINNVKNVIDNKNLLVINVIDNGISNKLLRKFPYYKGNRVHSIKSNNMYTNKFTKNARSFKAKISSIHKIDGTFKSHLTFYLPGESDFKIG